MRSLDPLRLGLTAGLLLAAHLLLGVLNHGEPVVPHEPLKDMPYNLGIWSGREQPLSAETIDAVRVTDYTNRVYFHPPQPPVQLYVGYYASQRTGDTMHSPKNCLPGSGWDPVSAGHTVISLASGRQVEVNEYVIQKERDKLMVLYWYQGRGRVHASEYAGKFWMVADAISRHRTDGALVRVATPMIDGKESALQRVKAFSESVFPFLDAAIPQ